jgi:hypothetical protein
MEMRSVAVAMRRRGIIATVRGLTPGIKGYTMHHHPFANPTLSPRKEIISPPKLTTFIYTQFSQNNGCSTRD